jgi:hypothetical protein
MNHRAIRACPMFTLVYLIQTVDNRVFTSTINTTTPTLTCVRKILQPDTVQLARSSFVPPETHSIQRWTPSDQIEQQQRTM